MESFKNILVIKSGALGDLIAGTTAIRALRNSYPQASITVLANSLMQDVCPPGSLIDNMIVFEPRKGSLGSYLSIFRELRRHRFDLAVNLRWSSEFSTVLTYGSGAKVRLGSGPKNFRWMYSHRTPLYGERRHEFTRHLDIVRTLGIPAVEPEPFVYISEEDRRHAKRFFESVDCSPTSVLLLHPGASTVSKMWMPERFGEIGRRAIEHFHTNLVVTWGPGEETLAQAVTQYIGAGASLAPQTTVGRLSAIIELAGMCVCNYSGVMNIAMAVKTPMVALGCTSPEDWGPYGPLHRTVNSAREYDSYTEQERLTAMESIAVEEVWRVVDQRWHELHLPQQGVAVRT